MIVSGHTTTNRADHSKGRRKGAPLYSVLDTGSEITVMTRSSSLRVTSSEIPQFKWASEACNHNSGESKPTDREILNFVITSRDGRSSLEIVNAHVMERFHLQKRPINLDAFINRWPHLSHVPIDSTKQEDVVISVKKEKN
jgi:hypothetical protein